MIKRLLLSRACWSTASSIFLVFIFFAPLACARKSQENLIQETIYRLGDYSEEKDVASIMLHIDDDYTDFRGRNKAATQDLLQDYFSSYRGIVVHMLSSQISLDDPFQASFQMDILVSSGEAKIFRKMIKFAGDLYRIKGRMKDEEGMWKITYADWNQISLENLFPDSLINLKKIFPNL